jgi:hypothetical protein
MARHLVLSRIFAIPMFWALVNSLIVVVSFTINPIML